MGASPLRMIGGVMAPLDRQPGRGAHARAFAPPQIPSRPSTRAVARLRVSGTFVRKEVIAAQDDGGGTVVAPFDPSRRRRPASRPPPAPQDEWKDGFGLVGPSAGKGEDAAAVDVAVQGEGYFAEDGGGGGVAHFVADRVPGVDDGAVGGEEAVVPVGGLIVLEDVEAGVVEERAVVVDGVVADYGEAAGALGMELEGEEGEGAARADDAGELSEGGGLVGGVLEGVYAHRGVHRGGLEAGVRQAADGEVRISGEAEALRALFGLGDGDGREVDALHGESSTGEVGAGLAGDPEGGAAHTAGDIAEARARVEAGGGWARWRRSARVMKLMW